MPETFSVLPAPANAQTPVTPGSGSSGFTSNAVAYGDSVGALTATTFLTFVNPGASGAFIIGSTLAASTGVLTGALIIGPSSRPSVGIDFSGMQARTSASNAGALGLNPSGGNIVIGANDKTALLQMPSTVTLSTAVGVAGAGAAPPATPEIYMKVRIPNAAHTLTTLYIPAYLST